MNKFNYTFVVLILILFSACGSLKDKKGTSSSSTQESRPTLYDLCAKYSSDKCHQAHNFIEFYDRLFTPKRDSIERFFEIGILNGASHLMWKDFFPNAEIYGIDLKDYSEKSKKDGIHTFVANQANRDDLQAFIDVHGGNFDVILDDGGHAMDHQQISLGFLFQFIKPGGYFIIEDVHTSLPGFYPSDFHVNETQSNTTLLMIERYIRTSQLVSEYMTPQEMMYLQKNIESIELTHRTNRLHSTMCIIQKKKYLD